MPSTISELLVVLFAVLPGVPGNLIYQRLLGRNRKEEQWATVIRMIGFSIGGLILYIVIGNFISAPLPYYISPNTFTNFVLERIFLLNMSLAFSGHVIGSMVIGFLSTRFVLVLNQWNKSTCYPDTWDKFIRENVNNHWVVVKLSGNEAYTGILERADVSVEQNERDIILKEPALYIEDKNNYISTSYQYLFLSGSIIDSIGVVSNPEDIRITKIGSYIFNQPIKEKENNHARRR
jgi:hypothetical protein